MTTYKTGNPLGSAAVKDLFDNAENLDHFENDRSNETWENRFGVPGKTRYGMEQEHDRQISSQEARFQQFLLSSGYVFLGDYSGGPLQFTARNQYIHHDGQYYRLNGATDVGFTTTGTDATSFANDVSHFKLMDGDALRQELSADSGAGLSGFSPKLTYLAGTLGAALKAQFQQGQSLQWYYDIYGDWNVAWEQAQLAVYIHGLSPKILFPNAQIEIKRPLLHGPALGDWIHKNYPMLNFYDEATGNYAATWPYIVEGVDPSGSDGAGKRNGSQIIFTGSKSRDDKTWMNFGIVHVAPTELDQFGRTAKVLKSNWPARVSHRFVNIMSKCQDGLSHANVHGMVIYHGTHCHIEDSNIYQCYGAGILFDWSYDSQVSRCAILQCGRMSPDWNKAVTDGNTGAEYQTYAPFHVMCSARDAENDNSNFIRLYGCQIEDNNLCNADIIVSGNSSPVWVRDTHFENAPVYGVKTGRTIAAIGNYGVSKFGDDSKSTYDYASRPNNLSGGYIVLEGGAMYSLSYSYLIQATRYSGYQILNWRWPNSGGIKVFGGNDSVEGFIFNSIVGDINYLGGNASSKPLTMIGSECGNVTLDYTKGVVMKGVKGKALIVSNAYADIGAPFLIDGNFESANGSLSYADCRLWLTSKTVSSSMRTTRGNVEIAYNAYQMNTLGLV